MAINYKNDMWRAEKAERQRTRVPKEQQVRVNNSKGGDYDRFRHVALLRRVLNKKIRRSKRLLPPGRLLHINAQIKRIERCLVDKVQAKE